MRFRKFKETTMRFNAKTISYALVLIAGVAALAVSPALAFGLQGASQNHQTFEVTFTKWITGVTPSGTLLMAGFTGGDAAGGFVPGRYLIEK
jgi:hypothetical protein